MALDQLLDLHDSDILKIEAVYQALAKAQAQRRDLAAFDREIHGRFEEAGFVVKVDWYLSNVDGTYVPEVSIEGRTEPKAFDYERQGWEITHDVLDLGEGGTMKAGKVPEVVRDMTAAHKRAHSKGSSHSH